MQFSDFLKANIYFLKLHMEKLRQKILINHKIPNA